MAKGSSEHEAHLSTQQDQKTQNPRIQETHVLAPRARGHQPPSSQRPQAPRSGHATKNVSLDVRPGLALGRDERLRSSKDFRRVQAQGRRAVGPNIVVVTQHGEQSWSRFGLTVTRKVGKAVVRNRVKRRLREILRQHKDEIPQGCDFVLIARLPIVDASYALLRQEVLRLCREAADRLHKSQRTARPKGGEPRG